MTFLSKILTLTQLMLMKVTHKDQILLFSRVLFFMIQETVKIGKLVPLSTQLYYNLQILNCMVKVRTLRPLQTWITMIVPNKHPTQARKLKSHMNPCTKHRRSKVTTLQRLRSTILPLKFFQETSLVVLEAENTIYALILILITQKYTDNEVCKFFSSPFRVPYSLFTFTF